MNQSGGGWWWKILEHVVKDEHTDGGVLKVCWLFACNILKSCFVRHLFLFFFFLQFNKNRVWEQMFECFCNLT